MLLNFSEIYKQFHAVTPIRGVVHVGAYDGGERVAYGAHGIKDVVWFEALSYNYEKLQANIKGLTGHTSHNLVLSDVDGNTKFHVTNNGKGNHGSSSILPLGKHAEYYPHVVVQEILNLPCRRLDTLAKQKNLPMERYNFLNIDVQGAELRVIRGMGDLIDGFDYVMAEINEEELYKGGVLLPDLEAYLAGRGFEFSCKEMTKYHWGDGLFVRKRVM